jgi:hypothetical protein
MLTNEMISLIVALMLTMGFVLLIFASRWPRQSGFWPMIVLIFITLFFASWAGGHWADQDELAWGMFWVPLVMIGVLGLLYTVAINLESKRQRAFTSEELKRRQLVVRTSRIVTLVTICVLTVVVALVVVLEA